MATSVMILSFGLSRVWRLQMSHCGPRVSLLLYPAKIPPIPRQRWANSLHSQGEYTLLANVHNILQRAGPRWLQRVSGEVPPVLRPLDPILDAPARCRDSAWEFDSDGEAPPPEAEAMVEVDPFMLQAATGLAAQTDAVKEFNAKQKGRARKFVCGEPQHRLRWSASWSRSRFSTVRRRFVGTCGRLDRGRGVHRKTSTSPAVW